VRRRCIRILNRILAPLGLAIVSRAELDSLRVAIEELKDSNGRLIIRQAELLTAVTRGRRSAARSQRSTQL
jgi:hypothetical protein